MDAECGCLRFAVPEDDCSIGLPAGCFLVAAFIGIERLLRIDFDLAFAPVTYTNQALAGLQRKLAEFKSETIPAFGRPIGVIVNYTPDRAIRFDLAGNPLEILPRTHRLADPSVALSHRPIMPATLRAIMPVE